MIQEFNSERDWDQYHTPKNLAVSISIEAGELLENFQWEEKDIDRLKTDESVLKKVREELLMSKTELARKAGISVLTIDRVEKGMSCRLATKRKILLALGYNLSDKGKIFPED